MKFMMPNTRVSAHAIRNSVTPNCRPFSSCSNISDAIMKKGRSRALLPFSARTRSLHLTFLVVRVLVLLEDRLLDVHLDIAARGLLRLQQVEVLDRVVVD